MKKVSFDALFQDVTHTAKKIPQQDYCETGKYPIIDQGKNQIAGHTDLEGGLFEDVPAYVFGDHTRVVKYVDTPVFLGADGVKLLRVRDGFDVNPKYLFYALKSQRLPDTGYNRHFIIRLRFKETMSPYFFSAYMNSGYMKQVLKAKAKGAVNQANINSQELQAMTIYVPPISLQTRFTAFVRQVETLRTTTQKTIATLDTLKASRMQQYFA